MSSLLAFSSGACIVRLLAHRLEVLGPEGLTDAEECVGRVALEDPRVSFTAAAWPGG